MKPLRIAVDTNVLVSALIFPNDRLSQMMEYIFIHHHLVLSSYVIQEFKDVVNRKFPQKSGDIEILLSKIRYEYVRTPDVIDQSLFSIRDAKDYPVLYTAILENVDILITGDRDFEDIKIDKPQILTPTAFIKNYCEDFFI